MTKTNIHCRFPKTTNSPLPMQMKTISGVQKSSGVDNTLVQCNTLKVIEGANIYHKSVLPINKDTLFKPIPDDTKIKGLTIASTNVVQVKEDGNLHIDDEGNLTGFIYAFTQ